LHVQLLTKFGDALRLAIFLRKHRIRSGRFAAQLFAFSTADTHDAVLCKDTEELITVPARRCVDGVEHRFAEVGTVFRRRACVQ